MSSDFGSELVNLEGLVEQRGLDDFGTATSAQGPGLDVGPYFDDLRVRALAARSATLGGAPRGLIFYLPPGRFNLSLRPGEAYSRYELPENVQLYFCPGALLRPQWNVDLVIRGSVRAGKYQIFGYTRVEELPSGSLAGANTVPPGHIMFATRQVPSILPEWWGAQPWIEHINPAGDPDTRRGNDSSDALQAALDAGSTSLDEGVHRLFDAGLDRPRRPSIPVLLGGPYQCNETLRVECPPGASSLHLILRGAAGLGTPNLGAPSIVRTRPAGDTRMDECALRLGPGVDFEIQDVHFGCTSAGAPVNGSVDVVCGASEVSPRRGLFRRCTLIGGGEWALRIKAEGGDVPRHFVVDACTVSAANSGYLTERGIEIVGGAGVMLHVDGGLMGAGALPVPKDSRGVPLPDPPALPANATLHLTGGSVLLRAVQFHNASGPRPSRVADPSDLLSDLATPDGQEVFLAPQAGASAATATHLTAVQCECQGWWFLSRPHDGKEQVALVNVAHNSPNWVDENNVARYRDPINYPAPTSMSTDGKGSPPSVVWLGPGGQCLLLACRLYRTVLTDSTAHTSLTDVGTVFSGDPSHHDGLSIPRHYWPATMAAASARPPNYLYDDAFLSSHQDESFDGLMPHVVPIRSL